MSEIQFLSKTRIAALVDTWVKAIEKGCFSCQAGTGHGKCGEWSIPAEVVCTGCGYGYCLKCAERGCYVCMTEVDGL